MLIQCGLLLLLSLAKTTGNIETNGLILDKGFDRSLSFSHWPSLHNGASMWKMRREILDQSKSGTSEGGANEGGNNGNSQPPATPTMTVKPPSSTTLLNPAPAQPNNATVQDDKVKNEKPKEEPKVPENVSQNSTEHVTVPLAHESYEKEAKNATVTDEKLDLSGPGVVKRGVIVFGGFALLAVAYFIFYRRKSSKNDAGSSHNTIDANQFRYGVLQSEDRRDNLELSRIPLTMESDEDEDDDLEIFDLEQKKKSMSYVNLQVNDEEIVNGSRQDTEDNDRDNLLLDIEDANSDTLINWSNNTRKSIL